MATNAQINVGLKLRHKEGNKICKKNKPMNHKKIKEINDKHFAQNKIKNKKK